MSTSPPPSSRSKKRSRLFQAAPDALFVEEWVPNITLPPPPDEPLLEDDEDGVKLDEHGLPERSDEDEEPEVERTGPARIYVGPGAGKVDVSSRDELPVSEVQLPDLSLPRGDDVDIDDDSDPSMPDLSIDGSGSDWGSMFDKLDDERPTDPELDSGDEDSVPVPMPAATRPETTDEIPARAAPKAAAAEPEVQTPRVQAGPPRLDRPKPVALDARASPSWARPSKPHHRPSSPEKAKQEPPRIRPTQPKPPEPGLGALVPRSAIIAVVLLVILVVVVLLLRKQGADPVEGPGAAAPQPAGPPPVVQIEPGTMDLDAAPEAPEPAEEAEPAEEPPPAGQPEAVEEPAPTPAATQPPENPRPRPAASVAPEPAPEPKPAPEPAPPAEEPVADASGPGYLVVESDRYAMVYMGGRRLGGTPIARMELDPGSYAVRAVCRDTGATKTMQVEVDGGQLTTASFRFMP